MPAGAPDPAELEALRRASAFVYVEDLDAPSLSDEDLHHLTNVLRLRAGERVIAADGKGAYVSCDFVPRPTSARARGEKGASDVLVKAGEVRRAASSTSPLRVAFALPKGERAEWTVQKLTEIGIDVIAPIMSARSVVRLDEADARKRATRLSRIAREAGAQSRRPRLPEILEPVSFGQFCGTCVQQTAVLAEPGGGRITDEVETVIVGPEGGWSDDELAAIARHVDLGPGVLRAETAAIVAGTLLVAKRAGLL